VTERVDPLGTNRRWDSHDWWILLCCLVPGLLVFRMMVVYAVNVPYWDNWNMLILGEVNGRGLLALWALVNEHRVFIPRIVDVLLARVSNFNILLWVWVKVPAVMALIGVEYLIFRRLASRVETWAMVPWMGLLNFSLVYWPMWIDPRPLGSHFAMLGFLVGLWTLTAFPVGWMVLISAIAGAVFSSLSFASGNVTWFVLGGVLWFVGYRKLQFYVVWIISATAVLVPYVIDILQSPSVVNSSPTVSALKVIRYGFVFLGSLLSGRYGLRGVDGAMWLGVFGCLAAIAMTVIVVWTVRDGARRTLPWIVLMVWVGLAAGAAGVGRAGLGLNQALSPRYVNTSSGFWISVAALSVIALWGRRREDCSTVLRRIGTFLSVVVLVSMGAFLVHANVVRMQWNPGALSGKLIEGRQCLLEYPECEDSCLKKLYPNPEVIRNVMEKLVLLNPSFLRDEGIGGRSGRSRRAPEYGD